MKIKEFRELDESARVDLVNKRLAELKEESKDKKCFKSEILEFSYPIAVREMNSLGYAEEGGFFKKEVKLSEYEIKLLKNLAQSYEFVMKMQIDEPKVTPRNDDTILTTSVRMYNKVWKRFQAFSAEWPTRNSTDLLASAIEEYMNRFGFESYETLLGQGKITEKK